MMTITDVDEKYQIDSEIPMSDVAKQYLGDLLKGERHQAYQLIHELVAEGMPLRNIYLDIFQRTQREFGYLWETNQISVAEEHYCTASTQMVMSQLYPQMLERDSKDQRVVIACGGGELHELGARMVADFFEMDGWQTYYVGANTPTGSLIETLQKLQPDLLGLSVTISYNIPEIKSLIEQINQDTDIKSRNMKIIIGGRPFNVAPDLWKKIEGVDGFAKDAEDAVNLANALINERDIQ